jgi:predicted CXXCH cytochrome family protein
VDAATVQHKALTSPKSCLACHDPHGSAVEHVLLKEPMALCLSCHDKELSSDGGKIAGLGKLLEQNPNHHGPIRQKNCTACHEAIHGGTEFRLLSGTYPPEFYSPFDEAKYAFCFNPGYSPPYCA